MENLTRSLYFPYVSRDCATTVPIGNAFCRCTSPPPAHTGRKTPATLDSAHSTLVQRALASPTPAPPPSDESAVRSLFLVSKGGWSAEAASHAPGGSGLRPGLFSCLLRPHESGSVKDLQ